MAPAGRGDEVRRPGVGQLIAALRVDVVAQPPWNDATSTITSVTDSAGNTYQLAAPVRRGTALIQAIYYARNIKAAAAGPNPVTVQSSSAVPYADVRIAEYGGLDALNPNDQSGDERRQR